MNVSKQDRGFVKSWLARLARPATQPLIDEWLLQFEKASLIAATGYDNEGNSYSCEGKLNQAAWFGENGHLLIAEIKRLREQQKGGAK